jgi:pimeloyl-ACP methyl ester carboxylesterase
MAIKLGINYELFNIDKEKTIIFLHGWGSNKEVMKTFKDSFNEYKLLFIDMPGFGKSYTDEIWNTQKYANYLDKFLKELNIDKFCIVGHSFGGKVATLLNPKYLVLLSSAGIIQEKPFNVKLKIKLFKLLKPFGGNKIRKLFVSNDAKEMSENMYQTFKNVVDEDFSNSFSQYKGKALVFGGDQDTAVTPKSNKEIAKLLNSNLIMLTGDHYFFLNKNNLNVISKEIKKLLKG